MDGKLGSELTPTLEPYSDRGRRIEAIPGPCPCPDAIIESSGVSRFAGSMVEVACTDKAFGFGVARFKNYGFLHILMYKSGTVMMSGDT